MCKYQASKIFVLFAVIYCTSCKEKFISPAPATATGYLVVEGVVNSDGDSTNIRLSRSTPLDSASIKPEGGASVFLEDGANLQLLLQETKPGSYGIDNLHLDTSHSYRLVINTLGGEQYSSEFVKVMFNPEIDSVSWNRTQDGVELLANTHDPSGRAKYYQWEFKETWEFLSPKPASLKWVPITGPGSSGSVSVTYRDVNDPQITRCWRINNSSNIITGTSTRLTQDVIQLPFQKIPSGSQQISKLYSVLLKQYAWNKEGYEFLERMRKNSETLGSVFDAQPSELTGNIHCISNASLPVIGFFNVSPFRQKRVFIYNGEVPGWNYTTNCNEFEVQNNAEDIKMKAIGTLPTNATLTAGPGSIISFNVASPECVDCTLTGTNVKPVFWP